MKGERNQAHSQESGGQPPRTCQKDERRQDQIELLFDRQRPGRREPWHDRLRRERPRNVLRERERRAQFGRWKGHGDHGQQNCIWRNDPGDAPGIEGLDGARLASMIDELPAEEVSGDYEEHLDADPAE